MDESPTRILLLVEDNPADADLVRELLDLAGEKFQVVQVALLAEAQHKLLEERVDVVILDLNLPDSTGVASVKAVREAADEVPLVVLTGNNNEEIAIACVDAGAQEYLPKSELQAPALRRSILYAVSRCREGQLRELRGTLTRFRRLSSSASGTSVTAAMAGSGSVQQRYPNAFQEFVVDYMALLNGYLDQLAGRLPKPREQMERVATRLGDAGSGPRDLIDVHLAALDAVVAASSGERGKALAVEGRLMALEMMGMLVDYYRTGIRRGFVNRRKS